MHPACYCSAQFCCDECGAGSERRVHPRVVPQLTACNHPTTHVGASGRGEEAVVVRWATSASVGPCRIDALRQWVTVVPKLALINVCTGAMSELGAPNSYQQQQHQSEGYHLWNTLCQSSPAQRSSHKQQPQQSHSPAPHMLPHCGMDLQANSRSADLRSNPSSEKRQRNNSSMRLASSVPISHVGPAQ